MVEILAWALHALMRVQGRSVCIYSLIISQKYEETSNKCASGQSGKGPRRIAADINVYVSSVQQHGALLFSGSVAL